MSIYYHHIDVNGLFACLYEFGKEGDAIPMHEHGAPMDHDVHVLRGSVRVNDKVLRKGDLFVPTGRHEIVALKPRTAILNKYLNGKPKEYENLDLEQLKGVINGREQTN